MNRRIANEVASAILLEIYCCCFSLLLLIAFGSFLLSTISLFLSDPVFELGYIKTLTSIIHTERNVFFLLEIIFA